MSQEKSCPQLDVRNTISNPSPSDNFYEEVIGILDRCLSPVPQNHIVGKTPNVAIRSKKIANPGVRGIDFGEEDEVILCGGRYSCSAPSVRTLSSNHGGAMSAENATLVNTKQMTSSDGQINKVHVSKNVPRRTLRDINNDREIPKEPVLSSDTDSLVDSLTSEMLSNSEIFEYTSNMGTNYSSTSDDFEINDSSDDSQDFTFSAKIADSVPSPHLEGRTIVNQEINSLILMMKTISLKHSEGKMSSETSRNTLNSEELHFLIDLYESRAKLLRNLLSKTPEIA